MYLDNLAQYIVVLLQYACHISQYIVIRLWHIVTALQCSDSGEALTRGPSVLSQGLFH